MLKKLLTSLLIAMVSCIAYAELDLVSINVDQGKLEAAIARAVEVQASEITSLLRMSNTSNLGGWIDEWYGPRKYQITFNIWESRGSRPIQVKCEIADNYQAGQMLFYSCFSQMGPIENFTLHKSNLK